MFSCISSFFLALFDSISIALFFSATLRFAAKPRVLFFAMLRMYARNLHCSCINDLLLYHTIMSKSCG